MIDHLSRSEAFRRDIAQHSPFFSARMPLSPQADRPTMRPRVTAAWKPTMQELAALAAGASIEISMVSGSSISVTVGKPLID